LLADANEAARNDPIRVAKHKAPSDRTPKENQGAGRERSVGVVREHFHLAPAGDLGGAADVIAVKGAALAR
jgi:hypothetical protein